MVLDDVPIRTLGMVSGTAVKIEKTKIDPTNIPEVDNAMPSPVRNRRAARPILDYDL